MSEIATLIARRGQFKGQLTRFSTFVKDNLENIDIDQIILRREKAKEVWQDYELVQSEIEERGVTEETERYRADMEKLYFETMAECERVIRKSASQSNGFSIDSLEKDSNFRQRCNTPTSSTNSVPSIIKLAAIEIPKFSGVYSEWRSFFDMFVALVHNNDALSDVQKFFYLRSSLSGDAERAVQCFQTTAENYNIAWQSLIERYNNNKLLVQAHTKSLYELEPVRQECAGQLRKLYDAISGHIKSLEALGQNPNAWGSLLLHLIASKMDYKTIRQWEVESPRSEVPSIKDLLDFLQSRFRMLEAIESSSSLPDKFCENKKCFNVKKGTMKSTSLAASVKFECYYCRQNHTIYRCQAFTKLSVSDRIKHISEIKHCKICLHSHQGAKCKGRRCAKCGQNHNSLLHVSRGNKINEPTISDTILDEKPSEERDGTIPITPSTSINAHSYRYSNCHNQILLSTALVYVFDYCHRPILCRVLLDSGSQNNFITESLTNQLRLERNKVAYSVYGINNSNQSVSCQVSTKIKSRISEFEMYLNFLVLPKLTSNIPSLPVNSDNIKIPADIKLADPSFDTPQKIDILLGAEIFFDLMRAGQLKPTLHGPIFKNTSLGWIVSGTVSNIKDKKENSSMTFFNGTNEAFTSLEEKISKFWQLEEVAKNTVFSLEEKRCKNHFDCNIKRDIDGRYVISLPFTDVSKLGKSYNTALRRFLALERRLQSDQELKKNYLKFMDEYLSLGHMEPVSYEKEIADGSICYYIPHHAVHKEDSLTTKLRVVFDASCKTNTGVSLNDVLLKGPCIQEELVCIMARFRTHKFVLSADITKMYRQIWVSVPHREFQRILWRSSPDQPIRIFRLKTVTYGVITSSFLATGCLENLAEQNSNNFPSACRALRRDFYMDDLLTGANTVQDAVLLRDELINILASAGFELRQWSTNEPEILKSIPLTTTSCTNLYTDHDKITKILGMYWNNNNDTYQYIVQPFNEKCDVTKRKVLSDISSVFDPLGLISPIVVRLKIIIQKLWLVKIQWDDLLPAQLYSEWIKYRKELESINSLTINRFLFGDGELKNIQLHGFADASAEAYGACLYVRSVNSVGEITVRLLCAKSRVAPLKVVSLPRLELLAALLLARLVSKYAPILDIDVSEKYYWSDSNVVLSWIASESSRWKTFVGHRVGEIQELTSISQWSHVSTKDNPADIVSRGCEPTLIKNNRLWWEGPHWLRKNIIDWPKFDVQCLRNIDSLPEERKIVITTAVTTMYDISILDRYSSINKLLRVVSYCRRFINNVSSKNSKMIGPLQIEEINNANISIIKLIQWNCWNEEIILLKSSRQINCKSKLFQLKPFLDENGLIRVGGRLKNSTYLDTFEKHQILLPAHSPFTKLLFINEHEKTLHGGPQIMLAEIRTKYWPFNGRNIARQITQKCVKCFRYRPVVIQPIMGNIPQARIEPAKPFQKSGVDFAGPFSVKSSLRRNAASSKAYACVWVCFVTKAVHIELVGDLTTQSFLNALKRFCDRRGLISDIYSDNATNFIGANRRLLELKNLFLSTEHQEKLQNFLLTNSIQWHFIPARSPHFGGLWEAAIKSMKSHLFKTLGNASLTFEELYSVLVRVEAILNSRPISPLSSDPSDLTALTPGHFLTGDIFNAIPEEDMTATPPNRLTRWRRVTQFTQQLWHRWRHDYLLQLQRRTKWSTSTGPSLAVNTVVLIRDDNQSPLHWRIGRITEVQPGNDGIIRVATVRTVGGSCKRAVRQLCPLPFEGNQPNLPTH